MSGNEGERREVVLRVPTCGEQRKRRGPCAAADPNGGERGCRLSLGEVLRALFAEGPTQMRGLTPPPKSEE